MTDEIDRRTFLQAAAASAVATAAGTTGANAQAQPAQPTAPPTRPVVIASGNGAAAVAKAAELLSAGADPLDAVVAGVGIVEADPNDHTVGLGGLPNEDGVVELDASVMHGPTHRAGAVGALRNVVHAAQVAQKVLERTDHIMLVGEGALRFARAHGFPETELLTDEARRIWLEWKENHSAKDDWLGAPRDPGARSWRPGPDNFTYGTINCCAVTASGDLAGVTTTSGLSYKLPGRLGDSPIIGAGLYVDNEVGAAGATGRGEAVILNSGAFAVIEHMRNGLSPQEATLKVIQRIRDHTREPRLRDANGRPNFQVILYALGKDGRYGSACIWSNPGHRGEFCVFADGAGRTEPAQCLYEGAPA